jgi:anti-sigma28 factor (negative regulator of flagellin synthesis)
MRIDDLNRTPGTQSTEKAGQTVQQRPADAESLAGSDQAEVSNLAQPLAGHDPARVEQLRLQVQSGNYNVSANAVASALIEAHVNESFHYGSSEQSTAREVVSETPPGSGGERNGLYCSVRAGD